MGLLPEGGRVAGGHIRFAGKDLTTLRQREWQQLRWRRIAVIFQAAMNSLNPLMRVGDVIQEALLLHERIPKAEARKRVETMLAAVGIPAALLWSYPHELSGGMRQRCVIALSLICRPELVIADEPTTAFDVILQDQILSLMRRLQADLGMAMIVISHDIGVIAELCERVAVMYAGRIVEEGPTREVFGRPSHPYTQALLASYPDIAASREPPRGIPGSPPDLAHLPGGCRFAPRCSMAQAECREGRPPDVYVAPGHRSACLLADANYVKVGRVAGL
jgi:peptide/nickel transport system ATP-binding protein